MTDAPQSRRARRAAEDEAADRGIDSRTLDFARGVATGEIPAVGVDGSALTRKDRRRLERLASPMETWTAEEERLATGQIPIVSPEVIAAEERAARERAEAASRDAYLHSQEFRRVAEREVRSERRDDFGEGFRDEPRRFDRQAAPGPDAVTDASRLAERDAFGGATPFSASQLFAAAPPRGSGPTTGSAATLGPRYDEPPTDARFPEEVAPRRAERFEEPAPARPRYDEPEVRRQSEPEPRREPEYRREPEPEYRREPEPRREPQPTLAPSADDDFDETVRYPSHYQTPPAWALERPADEPSQPRWVEPAQQAAQAQAPYDATPAGPVGGQPAAEQPFSAAQPFDAAQPPANDQPPAGASQPWDAGNQPQAQAPAPEWSPDAAPQAQAPAAEWSPDAAPQAEPPAAEPAPARGLPIDWFPPGSLQAASAQAAGLEAGQQAVQDAAPFDPAQQVPAGQTSAGQPSAEQPSAGQPSAEQASAGQPSAEQAFAAQPSPFAGDQQPLGAAPSWSDAPAVPAQPSADAAWSPTGDAAAVDATAPATDAPAADSAADPAEEIRRLAAEAMNNLERAAEQSSAPAEAPVSRYGDLGGWEGPVAGQVPGDAFPAELAQPQQEAEAGAGEPQPFGAPQDPAQPFAPQPIAATQQQLGQSQADEQFGPTVTAPGVPELGAVAGLPPLGAQPDAFTPQQAGVAPASGANPQAGVFAPTTGSNPQAGVFAPASGSNPQAGVFAPTTGSNPQAGVFAPASGSNPQAGVFAPATGAPASGAPASGAIPQQGSSAPTTALPQARPVTGAIPYAELTPTGQLAALRRAELPDKPDPKTFAWPHLGVIAALMVVLGVVIYNVAFGS